jgi:hypothetical protein
MADIETNKNNYMQLIIALENSKSYSVIQAEKHFENFLISPSDLGKFLCGKGKISTNSSLFFQKAIMATGYFKTFLMPNEDKRFLIKSTDKSDSNEALEDLGDQLSNKLFSDSNKMFDEILNKVIFDYLVYGYTALELVKDDDKEVYFKALPAKEIFFHQDEFSKTLLFLRRERISNIDLRERYDCTSSTNDKGEILSLDLSEYSYIYHLYIYKNSTFFTGNDKEEVEYRIFNEARMPLTEKNREIVQYFNYNPVHVANLFADSSKQYGNGDGVRAIIDFSLLNKYIAKLDYDSDYKIRPPWLVNTAVGIQNNELNLSPARVNFLNVEKDMKDAIQPALSVHDANPTIEMAKVHEAYINDIFSISDYETILKSKGQKLNIEVDTALKVATIKFSMKAQGIRYLLKNVFRICLEHYTKVDMKTLYIDVNSKEKELAVENSRRELGEAAQLALSVAPLAVNTYKLVSNSMSLYELSDTIYSEEEFNQRQQAQQQQQAQQEQQGQQ